MAVKFFGQFLMEKGAVSKEKLLQAIELQDATNLKFGATALSMGLLTVEDFERIHDAQRSEDLRFGDMAVKLGLLDEEQMQKVLTKQKNSHIYIGEALVKVGALGEEDVNRYLKEFKADQAPYMTGGVSVPKEIPRAHLWEMVADLSCKMLTRVAGLSYRTAPCQIVKSIEGLDVVASMPFGGSVEGRYLLSVTPSVRESIAKAILKEESVENESAELLDDTVMEFVNIVLGNVAAKAAQLGENFDISPPELLPAGTIAVPAGRTGLLFPLHTAQGERIELALFIEE